MISGWTRFVRRDGQWKFDCDANDDTALGEIFADEAVRHRDVLLEVIPLVEQRGVTVDSIREKLAAVIPLPSEVVDADFAEITLSPNPIVDEVVAGDDLPDAPSSAPPSPDAAPSP